jgi:hypothetical protein
VTSPRQTRFLVLGGVLLLVAVLFLWRTPDNPPGFHRDEASIALSATAISESLRDEDGALFPLYFESFMDYKSPLFVYGLAGVFSVTGPSTTAARYLAGAAVVCAVLLVGLLAWRRSRDAAVVIAAVLLAASTPWLYELGRYAVEATLVPLLVCLLLLVLDGVQRRDRWRWGGAALAASCLAAVTYAYAGGRVLAPLLAAALVLFAGRAHLRWLLATWGIYLLALVPLGVYALRHPGALTARYDATGISREGRSWLSWLSDAGSNYAHDVAPWRWATGGDAKPFVHASDYPALTLPLLALAAAGVVIVLWRRRGDRWWRFVLAATLAAPVPGALTTDRLHQLRMVALPILLCVLAIPALEALAQGVRRRRPVPALAVVALVFVLAAQTVHWQQRFRESGPGRGALFEAGVPALADRAFALGGPVHVDYDDHQAQAQVRWRAVQRDLPDTAVVVLSDGGVPAPGSTVFGRAQECDYTCTRLDEADEYWIARAG